MNKNVQKPSEPQFRPSIKKEEVKEKAPGQAEIVTDQLFTSV
jgi:predicted HAD superfamily phosphohydrolase YqeG